VAEIGIDLALQGGEVENGRRCYEPGSTVQGWTRLTPHAPVDCHKVAARLEWHTAGRGEPDQECADEVNLWSGRLSGPLVRDFTLTVPQQPWSYAGHYINIMWMVRVVVVAIPLDVSDFLTVEPTRDEPIVVAPRRATTLSMPPPSVSVPPDVTPTRRAKKRG
jgi:hypothetical protein